MTESLDQNDQTQPLEPDSKNRNQKENSREKNKNQDNAPNPHRSLSKTIDNYWKKKLDVKEAEEQREGEGEDKGEEQDNSVDNENGEDLEVDANAQYEHIPKEDKNSKEDAKVNIIFFLLMFISYF